MLEARGFLQKYGEDYYEVYAPVARMETIRLIVAVAIKHNWSMYQLDVKSAFLNGELEEEVYVSQPPGFEIKGKEDYVYKLDKALYGVKQAPRAWNKKIDRFLIQQGFTKCVNGHGIYCRNTTNKLIICLYADDMIINGSNEAEMQDFKKSMMNQFEMSDLGNLTYFLGIEFEMDSDWSGDKDDRKSTAAYVFMIGNVAFSWSSKKESVVALSSCEAEYISASMADF